MHNTPAARQLRSKPLDAVTSLPAAYKTRLTERLSRYSQLGANQPHISAKAHAAATQVAHA